MVALKDMLIQQYASQLEDVTISNEGKIVTAGKNEFFQLSLQYTMLGTSAQMVQSVTCADETLYILTCSAQSLSDGYVSMLDKILISFSTL